jgi:opine dehydrogenase
MLDIWTYTKGGFMSSSQSKRTWAVIGGGNGGQSAAGHLGMLGYPVRLFDIFEESVAAINKQGGVKVSGVIEGFGKIEFATTDMAKAVTGADIVMVITPASAHRDAATAMAPHLKKGQIVLIHPGATLGALEFNQVFTAHGVERGSVTICEAQNLIYATRLIEHGSVSIKGIKKSLAVGVLPASRTEEAIAVLREAFPEMRAAKNVLETSLTNLNSIVHPTPSLLNASLIESKWDWKYYVDGITPTIGALVERLDKERLAIGRAVGLELPDVLQMYKDMYDVEAPTLSETVRLVKAYWEIPGQKRIDTRYILDDIPTGLVPMMAIAEKFGVPCDIIRTICKLGNYLLDRELITTGRTLENLGLANLTKEEFLSLIENG